MSTEHPRRPAVAGTFYPNKPDVLANMVQQMIPSVETQSALAMMVPHAGYIYSGAVAGACFARVAIPETVLILSPKHTRWGESTAIWDRGTWLFPGFGMSVDEGLAQHLLTYLPDVTVDARAHAQEHGVEVLLPFLHARRTHARFVPIVFDYRSVEECRQFGDALAAALRAWPEPVLLVVSSDMNHFEDESTTLQKDQWALEYILNLDPEGLYRVCATRNISMCGVVPMTIALFALKHTAANKAHLIQHTTSAQVSGDSNRVVGYAGVLIE